MGKISFVQIFETYSLIKLWCIFISIILPQIIRLLDVSQYYSLSSYNMVSLSFFSLFHRSSFGGIDCHSQTFCNYLRSTVTSSISSYPLILGTLLQGKDHRTNKYIGEIIFQFCIFCSEVFIVSRTSSYPFIVQYQSHLVLECLCIKIKLP